LAARCALIVAMLAAPVPTHAVNHLQPHDAHALTQADPSTVFVDVRTEIESLYVGRPHGVVHIPWYEYPHINKPDVEKFASEVEKTCKGKKETPVLLICRSGKRTLDAAHHLEKMGFKNVSHVVDGFEGDANHLNKRSLVNGWRFEGLPWEQT